MLKVAHWQTALDLAANEYPVGLFSSMVAAHLGVSIEVLCAALLALGLTTRYAAASLLGLSLVVQLDYKQFDSQLFWIALFGWYTVCGAGPLSIDRVLRRGLATSALPAIPQILRLSEWIRAQLGPVYVSLLRVWLSLALLAVGSPFALRSLTAILPLALWLPVEVAGHVPAGAAFFCRRTPAVGLGRPAILAMALIVVLFAHAMMDPRATDAVYLLMIFSVLIASGAGAISLDRLIAWLLTRYFPAMEHRDARQLEGLPRVVIVGAGFGGISCALALRKANVA